MNKKLTAQLPRRRIYFILTHMIQLSQFIIMDVPADVQANCGDRSCMWMLHKPSGIDTDLAPGSDLHTILPEPVRSHRFHHVGRLDRDTSGLLLFSNDGDHTFTVLNSPSLEKTYLAQVARAPTPQQCQNLIDGVVLPDGLASARSVSVLREAECHPDEIRPLFLNARVRPIEKEHFFIRVTTRDGRYRVVRRMLAAVGLSVLSLHRESVGPISLPKHSIPGECVSLSSSSITDLILSAKGSNS